jgi:hypothetical protein
MSGGHPPGGPDGQGSQLRLRRCNAIHEVFICLAMEVCPVAGWLLVLGSI